MNPKMNLSEASIITGFSLHSLRTWAKTGAMETSRGGRGSAYIVTAQALQNAVLADCQDKLGLEHIPEYPVLTNDDLEFYVDDAYEFYLSHLINKDKQAIMTAYNFPITGSIPSGDWELFGAILTGEGKSEGYGSDLGRFEIKSAVSGNGFEYQYHLKQGREKLVEDMAVGHIYVSYSRDYKDIAVRFVHGLQLSELFRSWIPGLLKNYSGSKPKQRYRKNVNFNMVEDLGIVVMEIKGGELVGEEDE